MDFHNIIKNICDENDIKYQVLSDNWVYALEKNNHKNYIVGYKFGLNSESLGQLLDDKYAFYELLKSHDIPVITYHIIFKNYNRESIIDLFYKYHNNVVIKGNTGTCGIDVFKIDNINDLFTTIDNLLTNFYSVCLCPYYDIENEYRLIVLDGEIKLIYGKKRPIIIGDGKSSIKKLLNDFNPEYFKNITLDNSFNRILKEKEKYIYSWKFNLYTGANIFELDDLDLKEKLTNIVKQIIKCTNLKIGSIDIIKTTNNELLVMESNSGLTMDNFIKIHPKGYDIAKNIYGEAILKMLVK